MSLQTRYRCRFQLSLWLAFLAFYSIALGQFPPSFDLASLDGNNAKLFLGELRFSGTGISACGDVNNDGILDLIISAPGWGSRGTPPDHFPGTVYVVLGGSTFNSTTTLGLENVDATNGFVIEGTVPDAFFGTAIVAGFDWNDDGVDDLAASMPLTNANGLFQAGRVYVIFGSSTIGAGGSYDLASTDGTNGFVINGGFADDAIGGALAAGDFNGDGRDDLAIRASNPNSAGQIYVLFGGSVIGNNGAVDLSEINDASGLIINGENLGDSAGFCLAFAGDLNKDGFDDFAIGAPTVDANGLVDAGRSYVVFGGPNLGNQGIFELSDLNGSNGFVVNGPQASYQACWVSGGGDVNRDGYLDLVVAHHAGAAVIFGGPNVGSSGVIDIAGLTPPVGFRILNSSEPWRSAMIGDINLDGAADIAASDAYRWYNGSDPARIAAGMLGVVFGNKQIGEGGDVDIDTLTGLDGFQIWGDETGRNVGYPYRLGDLNGDGVDDFGIAARFHRGELIEVGGLFVVFGRRIADLDVDGDVDMGDFADFILCYNGSLRPPHAACPPDVNADFDHDDDVDLNDYVILARSFTGPR